LENHVERLADDHAAAQAFAEAVRQCDGLRLQPEQVDTNIVIFEVDPALGTAAELVNRLDEAGVRVLPVGAQLIRAVTHMDVTIEETARAGTILVDVMSRAAGDPAASSVATSPYGG
jgi:threonine aldolase